jgi:hypothetical protein
MPREREREKPLPAPDTSTVEQRDVGYVVLGVDGKVLAGPFRTNEAAWHWIDRNERYEGWQRRSRWA